MGESIKQIANSAIDESCKCSCQQRTKVTRPSLLARIGGYTISSLAFPAFCAASLLYPKWRLALVDRFILGKDWKQLGIEFSRVNRSIKNNWWFHGASVGEFNGLKPIISRLLNAGFNAKVFCTTMTSSGKAQAQQSKLCDFATHLPFDHPLFVNRALDLVQPNLLVIAETELWPNLIMSATLRNIPVVIVNGRISDYSWPRYRRMRLFCAPVLRHITMCLVQSEKDRERFNSLGVKTDRIKVVGSTKYDARPREFTSSERDSYFEQFGLNPSDPVFIAGSVRPGEDEVVLDAYLEVRRRFPNLQLIIAPRHKEKFGTVKQLLCSKQIEFNCRSSGLPKQKKPVLLLDTYGELAIAYALGAMAFVGATLVDIGGHNPFEPASFSLPVIVGPFTRNVADEVAQLLAVNALFYVSDRASLIATLETLCSNPKLRQLAGAAAYNTWRQNLGATDRVIAELSALMKQDDHE